MVRKEFFLLLAMCLVFVFSAHAQTVKEAESSIIFLENTAEAAIVIENPVNNFQGKIFLEILDETGKIRAQTSENKRIKRGRETHRISFPVGDLLQKAKENISWYRLKYRLTDENENTKSNGIASLSELLKDVFELRVAAAEYFFAGQTYRVKVRAVKPITNLPVKNVKIEGALEFEIETDADEDEIILKTQSETDSEGFATLDFKIVPGLKVSDGDLTVTGSKNGIVREIYEDLETTGESGSVFLTTDKPIYQPGQDFKIRALYFDNNNTVVTNSDLEFIIKSEDDLILYKETLKTSEFGIASVSWQIPENSKLGEYRVEIKTADSKNLGSQNFKVTRYDLPNFSVTTKTDKTFYLPTDTTAEITVKADYLFGQPVLKGKVRIVQEEERRWNYKEQKYDIKEKQTFEGEVDSEGKFVAKINLSEAIAELKENDWSKFEDLKFAAYFTDLTTNKTEQRRFDIRISKEPIHVYLNGNRQDRNPDTPITSYISTFYADGMPVSCDVRVNGKNDDDDDDTYKKIKDLKTNALGAGKIEYLRPKFKDKDDDLALQIIARDKNGQTGTIETTIYFDKDKEGLRISIEKTIFKPGESVKIDVFSTRKDALVYLDIVKDWTVIESRFVKLKNGKSDLKIPYNPNFKGELTVSAYFESDENENSYYSDDLVKDSRGIIFPEQQNLQLDAQFSEAVYKPNEEASVKFSVFDGIGKAVESALGIVVFDKAVEERARTDAEFGSYFSRFFSLLGYAKSFGGVTLKDLNELDLSKPVSDEIQLAAEVMLANNYYYPRIYRTRLDRTAPKSVYAEFFKNQFAPIEEILKNRFEKDYAHPTDENSLRQILSVSGMNFDEIRDPWGQNYQASFSIDKTQNIVTFKTAGADKTFGTKDDFTVSTASFAYFTPFGKAIDAAVKNYYETSGGFIRDAETLKRELLKQNINLDELKDRWTRDYRIEFDVSGRNYVIRFHSNGADGVHLPNRYNADDFTVWQNSIDYFAATETKINKILSETVNAGKRDFPKSENEFAEFLQENDIDFAGIKDGYGEPVYAVYSRQYRFADNTVIIDGKQQITPVTEELTVITLRSKGKNRTAKEKLYNDDFDLAAFSIVLNVQSKDTKFEKKDVKTIAFSGANGAIRGTVTDATGAVVGGANATATNETDLSKIFNTATDENGAFLIENIPAGSYSVRIDANGFKSSVYTGIQVRSQNLIEMNVTLEIGSVSEVVEVSAASEMVNTSDSKISIDGFRSSQIESLPMNGRNALSLVQLQPGIVGRKKQENQDEITSSQESSTPRLREYFPETLVWNPELITDKNGKAEMKFKLADNITTWKLYTVASTKNGKIGITEKEIQAFQTFFVDLDPPKFLTEGDEIFLPTQVRNYTETKQKVDVTMAKADWFSFLKAETRASASVQNSETQQIEVASGASENAVFGFKADSFINGGKQRVTAIGQKESDAIEKPVTVRPNGQEIVKTDSRLFKNAQTFDVNFPANALPKTQKAEVKIFPNLFSHVAESVEGLLQRPYGCGEQTISSTYPNLLILKFKAGGASLEAKAQRNLAKGYERILGYQVESGGFSYWGGRDEADIALTAYAIRFLNDARGFVEVDENVIKKAQNWLIAQQQADGSFQRKFYYEQIADPRRTKMFTSYVARILAMQKAQSGEKFEQTAETALQKSLVFLKTRNSEIDEPYALALFGLASMDAGHAEDAKEIAEKLTQMAIPEADAVYWNLETNTPFYGWGTAGRIETTALVLQLLNKFKVQSPKSEVEKGEDQKSKIEDLISKGTLFLLKNKDRYGVWYSTQTTVNVLDAFLATLENEDSGNKQNAELQILLNGENLQSISVSVDQVTPIILDLSNKLNSGENRLEIRSSSSSSIMTQVVSNHYIEWQTAEFSNQNTSGTRQLRLDYKCDKQTAEIMQEISCSVETERVGFKGYGMLLAEIGTPPGADISRESLEEALKNDWSLSRYDILPDRIIFYMWSKAGGTRINFKFKPRYGINAQTPASIVYDYYNPEAQALIAPLKFSVK